MSGSGISCIELAGLAVQVVKREPIIPPENFVDRNTYAYRRVEGNIVLKGIILGPGWENRGCLPPGKLSCYNKKGEDDVAKKIPSREKLLALWKKHEGKINPIARELGVSWAYAKQYLVDAGIISSLGEPVEPEEIKKQTQPAPEPVGIQEAGADVEESAQTIIPEPIPPVKMPIGCALPKEIEDEDSNPYSVEPVSRELSPLVSAGNEIMVRAWEKITAVTDDPVALSLLKELLKQGVA